MSKETAKRFAQDHIKQKQRRLAYLLPAINIETNSVPTTETCRQADIAFADLSIKGYKIELKKAFFRQLLAAGKRAWWDQHVIRIIRSEHHPDYSSVKLQVIDAAVRNGYFTEYRSPRGGLKMSRLAPTAKLEELTTIDPWTFAPDIPKQLVFLRSRLDHADIPFDLDSPIPKAFQEKLERINSINADCEIIGFVEDKWDKSKFTKRQLRPVHYALFTDDFQHHGRIYTGKYGHQQMKQRERRTISFSGSSSIELDYSGFHTRLLYHLEGIDYQNDPYALWGKRTTDPQRLLAKLFINALINADTPAAAISASNRALSTYTNEGKKKEGQGLEDARKLYDAYRAANVKFSEMLPIALKYHHLIAHRFGQDAGIELMNKDGELALSVLHHFAKRSIPCLGCHDSFVVPVRCREELHSVMKQHYEDRFGLLPVIKDHAGSLAHP